jgi:(p)ppGpp synthase/HD superfamily hydrolase
VLLHDAVEDQKATLQEIRDRFGDAVASHSCRLQRASLSRFTVLKIRLQLIRGREQHRETGPSAPVPVAV